MASKIQDDGSRCPICFEIYREPKALVCLHTFCEKCIHEYILQSKEKELLCKGIECPLCRFVTSVETDQPPESWAKSLRPNFALASLLESTSCFKKLSLEDEMCQPCLKQNSTNPATIFCTVCNERLCNECKRVHDSLEFTKNHKSVSTERKENDEYYESFQSYQKCDLHGKKIKFYCKTEEKLCCSTCAIISHRDCKELVEVSQMGKDRHCMIQGSVLRKKILEQEKIMKTGSEHFEDESKKLTSQLTESMSKWKHIREKLIQHIGALDDAVTNKIKKIQCFNASEVMPNAAACDDMAFECRRLLNDLDLTKENGTEEQNFVVRQKLIEKYEQQKSQAYLKFAESESLNISLKVSQEFENVLNTFEEFVSLSVESKAVSVLSWTAKTLKLLVETKVEKDNEEEHEPWFRGLGFLNDGRIVVCDSNNKKCVLMTERFEKIGFTYLQAQPLDIAVTEDNLVIITTGDNQKLLVYCVEENNTLIEKDVIPVTRNCDSASLFDVNKGIFGTFGSKKPVHVITFDGVINHLKFDFEGKQFTSRHFFKCCFAEETNILAVTDCKANAVYICDLKNGKMHTFKDDRFVKLQGIAHYLNDTFFICSAGNDSVVQMSAAGTVIAMNKVNMKCPHSICVSPDREKLLVSNDRIGDKKLLLFKIQ